jgi:hypothetical protein
VALRTSPQQYAFNQPFQLGTNSTNRPCDAQIVRARCRPGDVIITATDGLLDNLFDEEVSCLRDFLFLPPSHRQPIADCGRSLQSATFYKATCNGRATRQAHHCSGISLQRRQIQAEPLAGKILPACMLAIQNVPPSCYSILSSLLQ